MWDKSVYIQISRDTLSLFLLGPHFSIDGKLESMQQSSGYVVNGPDPPEIQICLNLS